MHLQIHIDVHFTPHENMMHVCSTESMFFLQLCTKKKHPHIHVSLLQSIFFVSLKFFFQLFSGFLCYVKMHLKVVNENNKKILNCNTKT